MGEPLGMVSHSRRPGRWICHRSAAATGWRPLVAIGDGQLSSGSEPSNTRPW